MAEPEEPEALVEARKFSGRGNVTISRSSDCVAKAAGLEDYLMYSASKVKHSKRQFGSFTERLPGGHREKNMLHYRTEYVFPFE